MHSKRTRLDKVPGRVVQEGVGQLLAAGEPLHVRQELQEVEGEADKIKIAPVLHTHSLSLQYFSMQYWSIPKIERVTLLQKGWELRRVSFLELMHRGMLFGLKSCNMNTWRILNIIRASP